MKMLSKISGSMLVILLLINNHLVYASGTTAQVQATATLSSVCQIAAQNLNFGNLVLPLSAQSASTTMNVQCTNNTKYTINLAYGGVYGTGSTSGGNYWVQTGGACKNTGAGDIYTQNGSSGNYTYTEYNAAGQSLGWGCTVYSFLSSNLAKNASYGSANASETYNGQTIFYNTANPPTGVSYAYGEMIGVANGDKVAYSIAVPGNPSQVWNAGVNEYSATGSGLSQSIPVVGTIVPAQSGGSYPTPDYYLDTVTATVSF